MFEAFGERRGGLRLEPTYANNSKITITEGKYIEFRWYNEGQAKVQAFWHSLFSGFLGQLKQCTVAATHFHFFGVGLIIKFFTIDAGKA